MPLASPFVSRRRRHLDRPLSCKRVESSPARRSPPAAAPQRLPEPYPLALVRIHRPAASSPCAASARRQLSSPPPTLPAHDHPAHPHPLTSPHAAHSRCSRRQVIALRPCRRLRTPRTIANPDCDTYPSLPTAVAVRRRRASFPTEPTLDSHDRTVRPESRPFRSLRRRGPLRRGRAARNGSPKARFAREETSAS